MLSRHAILLCGRKRTGKETSYKTLQGLYTGCGEVFFAKPLKDFCINALGLTHGQMYGTNEERESLTRFKWGDVAERIRNKYKKDPDAFMTAREVIQVVGTDVMRDNFSKNVWANAGIVAAVNSEFETCIFTDVRMVNELLLAKDLPVYDERFGKPYAIRLYRETGLVDPHPTEAELDIFDAVPNQRSLTQGVPPGFAKVNGLDRLYGNYGNPDNPFTFLIDNNGTQEELKENIETAWAHSFSMGF